MHTPCALAEAEIAERLGRWGGEGLGGSGEDRGGCGTGAHAGRTVEAVSLQNGAPSLSPATDPCPDVSACNTGSGERGPGAGVSDRPPRDSGGRGGGGGMAYRQPGLIRLTPPPTHIMYAFVGGDRRWVFQVSLCVEVVSCCRVSRPVAGGGGVSVGTSSGRAAYTLTILLGVVGSNPGRWMDGLAVPTSKWAVAILDLY